MPEAPRLFTRRRFVRSAGSAGSLLILPGGIVRGKDNPANKLDVAFIGMGGQIQGHVSNTINHGHNVVAFCDVDPNQVAASLGRHGKNAGGKISSYGDYRRLLAEEKSIDAVVIATPDHWHAPICRAAMAAGKHVYCEKPLTHTVAEARELRELTKKSKVVTQTGNQGSASPNLRRSMELIAADLFGNIRQIHVWHPAHGWPSGIDRPAGSDDVPEGMDWDFWLGTAPARPYKSAIYHPAKWRGWYDFGNGSVGDFCCHGFNLPMRALKLDYPTTIEISGQGLGKESFAESCTVTYHFAAIPERDYPVALIFYTGGDLPPDDITAKHRKTFGGIQRTGAILVGDKGQLNAGLWNSDCHVSLDGEEKFMGAGNHEAAKAVPTTLPRVEGQIQEWFDACRGKGQTFADFEHGGHLTEIGLAGIVALRLQKNLEWDGPNMKAKGMPEADMIIRKENRSKWL